MKAKSITERTCPICGRIYTEPPALSRADGKTLLCPDCGTRQALESIGVTEKEQDQILHTIHRFQGLEATENDR